MLNNVNKLQLAAFALIPALAACGGGAGSDFANGLPYADGTQNGGPIALEEGDRVKTQATGIRLQLVDQLVRAPISIERVDATHLEVSFNGETYLLEQVGSEASTVFDNAAMSIDFDTVWSYDSVSLGRMTFLGDGGISAGLVAGYLTDPSNMPSSGDILYLGTAYIDETGGMGVPSQETWDLTLVADFDESHVSALFETPFGFVVSPQTPFDGNGFTAELIAPGGLSGAMDGAFYTENGYVVAGNVYLTGGLTLAGVYAATFD